MKNININLNDLTDVWDRIWEECQLEDCHFCVYPESNRIEVYANEDKKLIARINIVNITDSYDIAKELFSENK